jgi:lipopolysaccharide export system protein LptC
VEIQDATLNARADAMEYDARQRIVKLTGRVHARYLSGNS